MWKGLLGGALLGLGLGALFSHFGIGGAMASCQLDPDDRPAGLCRDVHRAHVPPQGHAGQRPAFTAAFNQPIRCRRAPRRKSAPACSQRPSSRSPAGWHRGGSLNKGAAVARSREQAAHTPWGVPADFDTEAFLRHAKSSFIRMQAAWDKGDVADLREFTTPEVFAELKMQIQERGANADFTDVVSIDAQLLGIETTAADYLASVQFNGMIRTAPNAPAEPFAEVWNMEKPLSATPAGCWRVSSSWHNYFPAKFPCAGFVPGKLVRSKPPASQRAVLFFKRPIQCSRLPYFCRRSAP
jgi:predicted lipid-binding transport protein (Tim44 family)